MKKPWYEKLVEEVQKPEGFTAREIWEKTGRKKTIPQINYALRRDYEQGNLTKKRYKSPGTRHWEWYYAPLEK